MSTKKNLIVAAAIRCIAQFGLAQTNARLIGQEMGIPPSLVFYYFPKPKDLFLAMLEAIVANNQTLVQKLATQKHKKNKSPTLDLESYLIGNVRWAAKNRSEVATLMSGMLESSHDLDIEQLVSGALAAGETRLYQIIATGIAEKLWVVHGDIRAASELIHGALIGAIVSMFCRRDEKKSAVYERRVLEIANKFVTISDINSK